MAINQNCGNCGYSSRWELTPTGRFKRGSAGWCEAKVVTFQLPSSVTLSEKRNWVQPDDGTDCKAWKAKP